MATNDQDDCPHEWGPVEIARMTGNPHRRCTLCRFVTLDLTDDESEDDENGD